MTLNVLFLFGLAFLFVHADEGAALQCWSTVCKHQYDAVGEASPVGQVEGAEKWSGAQMLSYYNVNVAFGTYCNCIFTNCKQEVRLLKEALLQEDDAMLAALPEECKVLILGKYPVRNSNYPWVF